MKPKERNTKTKKHPPHQIKPVVKSSLTGQKKWIWIALAVVLITTFAIYFKAIKFGFLMWDDDLYITLNSHINDLHWTNIKLFFTEFYAGNYHPVTLLTYAIEHKLAGNSASLYHLNNLLIHLVNTFLVFALIRKLSPKNAAVALITAAFFAVHPMHVESVAWVSERKDVLYTFFFLLSLILYADYVKSQKLKLILFAGLLFLLSCLSKSAAVILPLVMLLIDYYADRKYSWKVVAEKVPFLVISFIFGIVALYSQKASIPVTSRLSVADHISVVSDSFITYLLKAFVPVNLSAFYPYPVASGGTLPVVYYLSVLCFGLLLFFVWYSRRWGKDVVFGIGFFVLTIILVLQIVSVGNAAMADRYTYVPYIGLFFIVGKLFEYFSARGNKLYGNFLLIALVSGFIIFSATGSGRVKIWENDETLFSDVIKKYPSSTIAYNNRGCYYLKIAQNEFADNNEKREMYLRSAVNDFNTTIDLDNNYIGIYSNRGLAKFLLKDYAGAIKDFDRTLESNPKDVDAYFNRGNNKKELQDFTGAIQDFDKTIELNPQAASAYFNRGNTKKELRDFTGAIQDFDKTIELNPSFIDAYNNRSILKCMLKDYAGAIADYDKIIELNPKDTATIKNRNIVRSILENSKK